MSKYEPLERYLREQQADEVPLTFRDIEKIIGGELPASQFSRAWWSNQSKQQRHDERLARCGLHDREGGYQEPPTCISSDRGGTGASIEPGESRTSHQVVWRGTRLARSPPSVRVDERDGKHAGGS